MLLLGSALALTHHVHISVALRRGGSDYALAAGAKLAIVTAGVRSREDESRLELLGRNVKVFESE